MRPVLLAPALLIACGTADQPAVVDAPDDAAVAHALPALSPEPLLDLVEDPRLHLGIDPSCAVAGAEEPPEGEASADALPADEAAADAPAASAVQIEVWTAACIRTPGFELEGTLTWAHGPDGASLVGDRAVLRRDGAVELALDGAIELVEQGDLLLLDAALGWCGPGGPSCDAEALTVDLSFSVFPSDGYPVAYDVTVSGAVGALDSLVSVEGVWSVDDASCPEEPANGVLALRGAYRHAFELDGAERCDGCAGWSVSGFRAPAWCGLDL